MENAMKAYELLDSSSKWTQRVFARDNTGSCTFVNDPKAVQWCLAGAIEKCYHRLHTEIVDQLWKTLGSNLHRSITEWNDANDRTYEEVYELLKANDI